MPLNLTKLQRVIVLAMLTVLAALATLGRPHIPSLTAAVKPGHFAEDYASVSPSLVFSSHLFRRPAVPLVAEQRAARRRRRHRHRLQPVLQPVPQPVPVPSPVPMATAGAVPVGAIQSYAESLVGPAQFACLLSLWDRESGWQWRAENPSGAYGIPQALPGSKMAAAGPDWQTNPYTQVLWGVRDYIDPVYGNACNAWAHEQAAGWY